MLIVSACFLVSPELSGQDPSFSNFLMSPMYYNPATCGGNDNELQMRMSYRKQWYGLKSVFNTYLFSSDIHVPSVGGLGLMAFSNTEGEAFLRTSHFGVCYANKYPLISEYLIIHLGMSSFLVQKSIDWSNIHFDDEFDKFLGHIYPSGFSPPAQSSVIYPDFNTGILITSKFGKDYQYRHRFYNEIGFSMSHITRPDYSLLGLNSRLPVKYVVHLHGSYNIRRKQDLYISPAFMFEQQASLKTATYGSNIILHPVFIGLWVRNQHIATVKSFDALSVCSGMVFEPDKRSQITISYNYDFTISRLKSGTLGTHEINVFWKVNDVQLSGSRTGRRQERLKNKRIPCPDSGRIL